MADGFIDKFSGDPAGYRQARPTYPLCLFEALAALAPARDLAWDCATGNGQAALGLAAHFRAVRATDASAEQIAAAAPAERVTYAVEPAEGVSLADGSADLVLAAQALHWFNLPLFYQEAARVLRPGGILAAIGYDWMYVDPTTDQLINRQVMPLLADYWAPQNALLWAGYRSIPFPGEELRPGAFAIHLHWRFEEVTAYVRSWSATRAFMAREGEGALESALSSLRDAWGEKQRHVVMPLHLRVSRMNAKGR